MDLRRPSEAFACAQQVKNCLGRVDLLVNNASVWLSGPFANITLEDWNEELAINLTGPFLCSQAVLPFMRENASGAIVNIADLSAFQTWPGSAHHSASKAGLIALTRVMAAELAPQIRVNAIAPGTVLLPEGADAIRKQWAIENSLLKRIGTPEDVAAAVIFLAQMDFVTGSVLFVDGGRSLL
jgi:NAD(P)-dependent dehydrogenase (short-subunit alcohol dehydrogenase family)